MSLIDVVYGFDFTRFEHLNSMTNDRMIILEAGSLLFVCKSSKDIIRCPSENGSWKYEGIPRLCDTLLAQVDTYRRLDTHELFESRSTVSVAIMLEHLGLYSSAGFLTNVMRDLGL